MPAEHTRSAEATRRPEGFVPRDEIVGYLERYASSFGAPVQEGVEVESLEPGTDSRFLLRTSAGELCAEWAVVCTGAYQRPHRPPVAAAFPPGMMSDAGEYRNPAALPPGRILVIGSGQTGCQLSEELHEAGREVFLSYGRAPWLPRRLDGHDIVTWLNQTTFFDTPIAALRSPADRLIANLQAIGRGGGHDLHYRTLQAMGSSWWAGSPPSTVTAPISLGDLADSVAFGDARYAGIPATARRAAGHRRPVSARPARPAPVPRRHARIVTGLKMTDITTPNRQICAPNCLRARADRWVVMDAWPGGWTTGRGSMPRG